MTTDPRIRDKVAMALLAWNEPVRTWEASYGMVRRQYQSMADVAIAAHLEALDEANTIRTVAELDALPVETVLRCGFGNIHRLELGVLGRAFSSIPARSKDFGLPARVLYRPEEA